MDTPEINPDDVRAFLRQRMEHHDAKKDLSERHSEFRNAFIDRTGLNKTGVAFCERLNRLSAEVRADVIRTIDLVREAMEPVWQQEAAAAEDMFPEETPEMKRERLKRLRTEAKREGAARRAAETALPTPEDNQEIQQAADAALEKLETGLDKTVEENGAIIDAGGRMRSVDEIAADVDSKVASMASVKERIAAKKRAAKEAKALAAEPLPAADAGE